MDNAVNANEPIDITTLQGKRYTIDHLKPLLEPLLDLSGNSVPAAVGLEIKKLMDGKQTNIIPLKNGDAAKLSIINNPDKGLSINVMHVQARLQLRDNYLGHNFTAHDKENLQRYGDMGRAVQLIDPRSGETFRGLVGIDPETHKMTIINTDKFPIPDNILGVPLDTSAKERLREGQQLRLNNLKNGDQNFSAFVRLSAAKRGIRFDKIKSPKIEQVPKIRQAMQTSASKTISPTPILDSLTFPKKRLSNATKAFPNGVEVLVIPQTQQEKFVLSIKLPEVAATAEVKQFFTLPIMAKKHDTEALLQLSQTIDKAIGKQQPLLLIIQASQQAQQFLYIEKILQKQALPFASSAPTPPAPGQPLTLTSSSEDPTKKKVEPTSVVKPPSQTTSQASNQTTKQVAEKPKQQEEEKKSSKKGPRL